MIKSFQKIKKNNTLVTYNLYELGRKEENWLLNVFWFNIFAYLTSWITWVLFIFGLVIGSFLNVCIFRIPEGTFWKSLRSTCRGCGKQIPFYLNIPVLSFVFLRGRSRCCKKKLSWQYPLVELAAALILVYVYWRFPFLAPFENRLDVDYRQLIRFGHASIFSFLLLVCAVIDMRHMIIPDAIDLPMIVLTPFVVYLHPDLDWKSALVGVLIGGGSLYLISWIYWLIRKEVGLGMGDVKLLAAIGGWLGYQAIFPVIVYGSVLGSFFGLSAIVISRKMSWKSAIPFGPFLAIGAIIHLLFGGFFQELFLGL